MDKEIKKILILENNNKNKRNPYINIYDNQLIFGIIGYPFVIKFGLDSISIENK